MKALTYVEMTVPAFTTQNIVMLHFDGVQDQTDIINSSALYPTQWFTYIDTRLYTSTVKFGTAALGLGGSASGYAYAYNTPELWLDTVDFTIDFWFNHQQTNPASYRGIAGQSDKDFANDYQWGIYFNSSSRVIFEFTADGFTTTGKRITGTVTYNSTTNTGWHHCAVTRSGNIFRLFIDGVQQGGNLTVSGALWQPTGNGIAVGNLGFDDSLGDTLFYGYIDEFRITKGLARWTANFTPPTSADESDVVDYRFAKDNLYLPKDVDCIPSIKSVNVSPAIISLGEDLGQRASVEIVFRDHKHVFSTESYDSGTFWGKFRARYGLKLTGYPIRLIRGMLGEAFDGMSTRHFIIDGTDGPNKDGEFRIVAKDLLKLADGDKAVAPFATDGYLLADITAVAGSFTLGPTGIGNQQYPNGGWVNIGGKEICDFSRSGDVLTVNRGKYGTTAITHSAGERVQLCLEFSGEQLYDILWYLFVFYAGVDSSMIPYDTWVYEIDTYLGNAYSALITEPTSVNTLVSELIEQAGLVIWWDDRQEQIRLQVLRPVASDAFTYDASIYMRNTFEVSEQPEKRLSEVNTYFARRNPLINIDQVDNYQSFATTRDDVSTYSTAAIKTVYSRWIPAGGRTVAQRLNDVLLSRFRDPPRKLSFSIMRRSIGSDPSLGVGYLIGGWPLQETLGSPALIGAQITRVDLEEEAYFVVEAEEISGETFEATTTDHVIIIDSNLFEVNLRTMHDSLYGTPQSGDHVVCTVQQGVLIGSSHTNVPAFDVGTWPGGVTITITNNGTIEGIAGSGGKGGDYTAGSTPQAGAPGGAGSMAFYTRQAVTLVNNVRIWGGGGGGGGGGGYLSAVGGAHTSGGGGGGGGAGINAGDGGAGGIASTGTGGTTLHNGNAGLAGSQQANGDGGNTYQGGIKGKGGAGGTPGVAGAAGNTPTGDPVDGVGGAGGAAGASIDGVSHVTYSGAGSLLGSTIN